MVKFIDDNHLAPWDCGTSDGRLYAAEVHLESDHDEALDLMRVGYDAWWAMPTYILDEDGEVYAVWRRMDKNVSPSAP